MIENLIRKHIRGFEPYRSARTEVPAQDGKRIGEIFLDANELSTGSPMSYSGIRLNRYPDPLQHALRDAVAGRVGVSRDEVFLGVGSDEVIDLLVRLFCEPGTDKAVILGPTYGVYRVAAELSAVPTVEVELDARFQIDTRATLRAAEGAKLLFCCSPNNPTGNLLDTNEIINLCDGFGGIVVVDQAYIDFSGPGPGGGGTALLDALKKRENLVILRTLSKGWGLAGIRLGYCVANQAVVSYLLKIKSPYNINSVTSRIALHALEKEGFLRASVRSIVEERERLRKELEGMESVKRVYPSDANFLLAEFADVAKAFDRLMEAGIVVRRRSEARLRDCLRMTVGTPKENTLLLQALREGS